MVATLFEDDEEQNDMDCVVTSKSTKKISFADFLETSRDNDENDEDNQKIADEDGKRNHSIYIEETSSE